MYSFNLVLFYIMTFSVVPTLIMMMNAPKEKAPKKNLIGLKDISIKSLLKTKNQYTITPRGNYEIRFKKEKVPKYSIFTDEKGKIEWDFKNEFFNNKFTKNFITSNPDAAIKISVIKPKQGNVKQRSIVLSEYRNYVDMQDEMQKNGGRLYMKDKIEFNKLRKNKTKPTENQKSKGRNLNVESDEQPLLGADQLADDEGGYEYEEHKDVRKIGKMPSKSRNGESSRSKGRSGASKQQKMPEYSPESSPIHHPIQTPRGQHDAYGYGAAGLYDQEGTHSKGRSGSSKQRNMPEYSPESSPIHHPMQTPRGQHQGYGDAGPYDQQNMGGYGTSQKQTEIMGANRGFMGGQGETMPAGYGGASPAGQGNYVPVPIPIEVTNGGQSSNEEQDDWDAELQNSGSDESAHIGNDSNSDHGELHPGLDNSMRNEEEQIESDAEEDQRRIDNENEDNSEEVENSTENTTSPAQSDGEHDGQTSEEEKSGDEQDQSSSEESEAGSGQTKNSDVIPNFLGKYESDLEN